MTEYEKRNTRCNYRYQLITNDCTIDQCLANRASSRAPCFRAVCLTLFALSHLSGVGFKSDANWRRDRWP
jgi:hypothetical protein